MPGREEDKPYEPEEIADAILDWLDHDTETRLGDDEDDYYTDQGDALPPNRPIFTMGELGGIPGMDDLLLETLATYFTAQPMFVTLQESGVNPNTAPTHILALLYQGTSLGKTLMTNDDVFRILEARQEGTVFCPPEYGEDCESFNEFMGEANPTYFPPLRYTSEIFSIRSVAQMGEVRACYTTVVRRSSEGAEFQTLLYRTDC